MTQLLTIDSEVTVSVTPSFVSIVKTDDFGLTTAVSLTPIQMRDLANVYQAHQWHSGVEINED